MEIINKYTTIQDAEISNKIKEICNSALHKTFTTLGLDASISRPEENADFLLTFAKEINKNLKSHDLPHFSVLIGKNILKVFRFSKNTLITIKWNKCEIHIFQSPLDPHFPIDQKLVSDQIEDKISYQDKYFSYILFIEIENQNYLKM